VASSRWRLSLTARAERQLAQLPEKVAAAVVETLVTIAENPRRMGKRLHFDLEGAWSARRGPYRILYEIDGRRRLIKVIAIGHRSDVYRRHGL
jgi:mRNA-degrading endonuclease RelE of RelBE toxin-antitoxin system